MAFLDIEALKHFGFVSDCHVTPLVRYLFWGKNHIKQIRALVFFILL